MGRITKKGLRGLGKRKLAGMHIDLLLFFFGFTATSTTIPHPLPPSFFVFLLHFTAMFFPQSTRAILLCFISVYTYCRRNWTNFDNGRRDCVWPAGPPGWHQEEKKDTPRI